MTVLLWVNNSVVYTPWFWQFSSSWTVTAEIAMRARQNVTHGLANWKCQNSLQAITFHWFYTTSKAGLIDIWVLFLISKNLHFLGPHGWKSKIKYLFLWKKNIRRWKGKNSDDTDKWKDILCSWRINMLKCSYHPKQATDSLKSLSKFQWHFSKKLNK